MKYNRIIQSNCIEVMKIMDVGSVPLIVADPPYNQGIEYEGSGYSDKLSTFEYEKWTVAVALPSQPDHSTQRKYLRLHQ
jgi:DNA modification methylase